MPLRAEIGPKCYGLIMTAVDLGMIQSFCFIPSEFRVELARPRERVHNPPAGWLGVYEEAMRVSLRFPLHPFVVKLLDRYALSLAQIAPNSWHHIIGFLSLCSLHGRRLIMGLFWAYFSLKRYSQAHKLWYFFLQSNHKFMSRVPSFIHGCKEYFFFIHVEQPWRFEAT